MSDGLKIIADRENYGYIPMRYTCDANDEFPSLQIKNIPDNAKSLVLIVDDPDAPVGIWDHFLLANIPVKGQDINITSTTKKEAIVGKNSWGKNDRGGPCPPSGVHRYFFKLFALNDVLKLKPGFSKEELLVAMKGKIIATCELVGLYQRQK